MRHAYAHGFNANRRVRVATIEWTSPSNSYSEEKQPVLEQCQRHRQACLESRCCGLTWHPILFKS
eukprot:m.103068 g.103068  ORF g.103068 m.103068 type:complete len:65 (-) comp15209_c1_seq3:60-254(-)